MVFKEKIIQEYLGKLEGYQGKCSSIRNMCIMRKGRRLLLLWQRSLRERGVQTQQVVSFREGIHSDRTAERKGTCSQVPGCCTCLWKIFDSERIQGECLCSVAVLTGELKSKTVLVLLGPTT